MKKIYMTMVAMLCGAAAMAQTCTISAEDVSAVAGGETSYVTVVLAESDPGNLVTGAAFKMELPAGITIRTYYDEDEEADKMDVDYPALKSAHKYEINYNAETNTYTVGIGASGSAKGSYFKTADTRLVVFGLSVPADFKDGEYDVNFKEISFSRPDPEGSVYAQSCYPQDPFSIKLTVTGGTGINGVNAENENAPVYNLAGQRLSKVQKGVNIIGSKKVIK